MATRDAIYTTYDRIVAKGFVRHAATNGSKLVRMQVPSGALPMSEMHICCVARFEMGRDFLCDRNV